MRIQPVIIATALVALLGASLTAGTANAQTQSPLRNKRFVGAFSGLNAPNCASLTFTATGTVRLAGDAALVPVTQYVATLNYGPLVSRVAITRAAKPKQFTQHYSDGTAWDLRDGKLQASPTEATERMLGILLTPHGALSAAMAPDATVTLAELPGADGKPLQTFTVVRDGGSIRATIGSTGLIDKVETVPGEGTAIEVAYSDYKDFDGIKFPTRIVERMAGQVVADLTVTSMTPNVGLYLEVPEKVLKAKK